MASPHGVWTQEGRLFVAETIGGNRRIMVWNQVPTETGQPADLVLGQASLESPASNLGPSQSFSPQTLTGGGEYLMATDGNRARILLFRNPDENGEAALRVLGQSNFEASVPNDPEPDGVESGPSARTFSRPEDVVFAGGRLFVADIDNNRVLVFEAR
mgnify:CR=1 FL=1